MKGKRERYTELNAEFQKIARRDFFLKGMLSNQCKEMEAINRMGKTRDLLMKTEDKKKKKKKEN